MKLRKLVKAREVVEKTNIGNSKGVPSAYEFNSKGDTLLRLCSV